MPKEGEKPFFNFFGFKKPASAGESRLDQEDPVLFDEENKEEEEKDTVEGFNDGRTADKKLRPGPLSAGQIREYFDDASGSGGHA